MSANLSQSFKKIDNILRRDAGPSNALHYVEQSSWILFLKYLEDIEKVNADAAELAGKDYTFAIDQKYRWSNWAVPKKDDGSINHNVKLQGEDLMDFVNNDLFKYLESLRDTSDPLSLAHKVGEIFSGIKQIIEDGYNLRDIVEIVDGFKFDSTADQHEMSSIYEDRIQQMGNAGKGGGEYYTPRSLIQAMINVVNPQIGETILDPSCGSAGFLAESYKYLLENNKNLTTKDLDILKFKTLIGKEKKALPFIVANMHLILTGIPSPDITRTNTLSENLSEIQSKDRVDVILANPPFGGDENDSIQTNFPIKTSATENMFMQYFIKKLKPGGRAAIVIKNTFLTNDDNATKAIRQELLTECNLHTILDMPQGTFLGAGVQTVVLFFIKGEATKDIWYYQLNPERNLGKNNPLSIDDFEEFLDLHFNQSESVNSWTVKHKDINQNNYDLAVQNPNKVEVVDKRTPNEIILEIEQLDVKASEALKAIKELL
jgi:type I restriction enzyme M protein